MAPGERYQVRKRRERETKAESRERREKKSSLNPATCLWSAINPINTRRTLQSTLVL
jgi:hypothetical protein